MRRRFIKGHYNYFIDVKGRVYSLTGNNHKPALEPLRVTTRKDNYQTVQLYCGNKRTTFYVHRLVIEAFIPNPDPEYFTQVNHKDRNRKNNCIDNLEWCDAKYNIMYKYLKQVNIG